MFKNKRCINCNGKVKDSFSFCPDCGKKLKEQDWGILGKNDLQEENLGFFEKMGSNMISKMIGSTMRMLEKEIQKEMKNSVPQTRMRLMINGKEIPPRKVEQKKDQNTKKLPIEFNEENLQRYKKLIKIEPETKLKRIGDSIRYELKTPGVKSIKDISIINLEKGIEIRAISQKKAYLKKIQISLNLKKYSLSNEKIILEMDS